MRKITATEIATLTAWQFWLAPEDLAQKRPGNRRELPAPSIARGMAVLLARRHTTATWADLCRLFDFAPRRAARLKQLAAHIEQKIAREPALAAVVSAVEREIDRLRGARTEKPSRCIGGLQPRIGASL
jgi:hypothetical protein